MIKRYFVFGVLVIFSLGCVAAGAPNEQIEKILGQYALIHASLSKDTTEGVEDAARQIVALAVPPPGVAADVERLFADVKTAAQQIQGQELKIARDTFFELSKPLLELVQKHYSGESKYFRYFCSMKNMGWIQLEEGVKNPYYGSAMLACGQLMP